MGDGVREHRLTAQDGLGLYYRTYGEPDSVGMPVLCLPGLTRNSADYDTLARRLAPRHYLVCPDYRGRGRSDRDPDWRHYTHSTDLADIRHVLAAAGVHRMAVIGTSYGGLLATALAVVMPAAIAGAVLNDVGPDIAPGGQSRILDQIATDRPQPDWPAAVTYVRTHFPAGTRTEAAWETIARNTFREGRDGLLHFDWDVALVKPLRRSHAAAEVDLWGLFAALGRVPVLSVRGALSDLLTEATVDRMAARHPGMLRVTVPGVGHAPALDEPEALAALDAFFDKLEEPAGMDPVDG